MKVRLIVLMMGLLLLVALIVVSDVVGLALMEALIAVAQRLREDKHVVCMTEVRLAVVRPILPQSVLTMEAQVVEQEDVDNRFN